MVEYYLAFKNKSILQYVKIWKNLEDVMISGKKNDPRKINTSQLHLHELSKVVKFIDSESGMVVTKG